MDDVVILGGGQAGAQVAFSLRDLGFDGPITIVSEEDRYPYQRPPLSKEYLKPGADPSLLTLREPEFYEQNGIDVLVGERVIGATMGDAGGELQGATGRRIRFDRLAIATGVEPRRLDVPGSGAEGVVYLRTADDADRLKAEIHGRGAGDGHVVIVGAGFVGLEFAAACRARDLSVTVIEAADRVLARGLGEVMSEAVANAHRERGTEILLDTNVVFVESDGGRVSSVTTSDGRTIAADLVVVGIGGLPRVAIAEHVGVETNNGIVVDEHCRTRVPGVVAAGDCAVMPVPWSDCPVRLESVPNALEQGRIAAGSLLGMELPYEATPWFWSDQGDLKLQMAGWTAGHDQVVVRGDRRSERFSALYYRRGALVSVEALNSPADFNAVKKALGAGISIPPDVARDAERPLRQVLAEIAGADSRENRSR